MTKSELNIMDKLMQSVTETKEWYDIQQEDPQIKQAQDKFYDALDEAGATLPGDLRLKLEDAFFDGTTAYSDAAILYGIHVADVIRAVTASPVELSAYALQRIEQMEREVPVC